MHQIITEVTDRITERSCRSRAAYLAHIRKMKGTGPARQSLSCGNLAHGFAAAEAGDKTLLKEGRVPNIAIITAYNDMLSAHQPYATYPAQIKLAARKAGATAQVAGGVPAMCDGVTQGRPGMELSLFSRDVIALATVTALSHNMFDGALCLGICDKIVPGMLIGALSFGHLPVMFVPSGPMPSGLPNPEKSRIRKLYAEGKVDKNELLEAEAGSYHAPGTCTFYGTANSNQMMIEIMGLMLPGSAFVNPGTSLRSALTDAAVGRMTEMTASTEQYTALADVVGEKAIVNAIVGLLASGGSTNHTIHLVAIARAAGILINWDDYADLSEIVPLLTRMYPNGQLDVNQFHKAGGMPFLIRELLNAGLLHEDVATVMGNGLQQYIKEPVLDEQQLQWQIIHEESKDLTVLRPVADPFNAQGGLKVLNGNLGRSVIKVSAVREEHLCIEAPCIIFHSQQELEVAFKQNELNRDFVAVIRFQGPKANGMPELHKLTPVLSVLLERGHQVALVTDGRMSGASGQVPAAIHVTPEAAMGGALARLQNGDVIRLDAIAGILEVKIDEQTLHQREPVVFNPEDDQIGTGRELFQLFRAQAGSAETGASIFYHVNDS